MNTSRKLFVGPRVRRLREQQGWNQATLAQRLSVSLSYVSQIENNQRPVTAGVLLKLAETFGGDIGQFSEDQDKRLLAEKRPGGEYSSVSFRKLASSARAQVISILIGASSPRPLTGHISLPTAPWLTRGYGRRRAVACSRPPCGITRPAVGSANSR